jgi:DNA-directed RNA polymerase subunit M/transcription elongation factor TFIIS
MKDNEYLKIVDGKLLTITDIDTLCKIIKTKFLDAKKSSEHWEAEFKKLQEETYKDKALADMTKKIKCLENKLFYGFGINEEEHNSIIQWMHQHKCKHCNPIYHFTPTGIGDIGEIECTNCGEKFTFRDID